MICVNFLLATVLKCFPLFSKNLKQIYHPEEQKDKKKRKNSTF